MIAVSRCAALAAAAALLSGLAAAQDSMPEAGLTTRPGWEVGAQLSRYQYEEPAFAKLDGIRGGLSAAYNFTDRNRFFFRIDTRVSHGLLDYEGSGTLEDVPDWIAEVRALYGRDFPLARRAAISPYIGFGLRQLYNDLRGETSTGAAGYRRTSTYAYLPLGATLRLRLGERWVVAPTLEYHLFLEGRQDSDLTDTGIAGLADVSNTQNRGKGYRASLMLENGRWSIGPWLQYWHVRDSLTQPAGPGLIALEPENESREYGIDLRYRF